MLVRTCVLVALLVSCGGGCGGKDSGGGGDGDDGSGKTDTCTSGTRDCACDANGACNPGLECKGGICVQPTTGSETYTIGGEVSGLAGAGLVLRRSGGESLAISTNGPFTFPTALTPTTLYEIVVETQPSTPQQTCLLTNATGTISGSNIANIVVTCTTNTFVVRATVTGLRSTLTLVNGTYQQGVGSNATHTLGAPLPDGSAYNWQIQTQPNLPAQTCTVTNGSGTLAAADVTFTVDCVDVQPQAYYANAPQWNDYLLRGTNDIYSASGACDVTSGGYSRCLHAGAMRKLVVRGITSCSGLTFSDDETKPLLQWRCRATTPDVTAVAIGLTPEAGLADLIDWSATPTWRSLALTVKNGSGTQIMRTVAAPLWSNPIVADPSSATLSAAGTVYAISANKTADYEITADRIAVVTGPSVTLADAAVNSTYILKANLRRFLWIEGTYAINASTGSIELGSTQFSVLRRLRLRGGAPAIEIDYLSANNYVADVIGSGAGNKILAMYGASNTATKLRATSSSSAFEIYYGDNNRNSRVVDVLAAGNDNGGLMFGGRNHFVADVTVANCPFRGVYLVSDHSSRYQSVLLANNSTGILMSNNPPSTNDVFEDLATAHGYIGIDMEDVSTTVNHQFLHLLSVGNHSTQSCRIGASIINAGVANTTCAPQGTLSAFTLSSSLDLTNAFVGKLSASDPTNLSDNTSLNPLASNVSDWFGFARDLRAWGRDGTPWPGDDTRGACNSSYNCHIWDYALLASNTSVRAVVSTLPSGSDAFQHPWYTDSAPTSQADCDAVAVGSWYDSVEHHRCETWALRHAVELFEDGIGNDNGLCESHEACLFTPNIGVYQGHGTLVLQSFTNGTPLTDITLYKYSSNGY